MEKKYFQQRTEIREIFDAAVAAVDPQVCIRRVMHVERDALIIGEHRFLFSRYQRIVVVGAGKGAAAMAKAVEELLGARIEQGMVITKYGHGLPLECIRVHEAAHPIPDESSIEGTEALVDMIRLADERTLLLCLLSGGGSTLMVLPVDGVSLADKQAVSRLLLESGATIHEVNTIRKHLSRIKGGGLARLAGKAQVVTLILSDVIGDDPGIIASGPTCQDETTYLDCLRILDKFSLWPKLPQAVRQYFTKLQTNVAPASDKPDTGYVAQHLIIGSNSLALEAAAAKAITLGYQPVILTSRLQGEAREVAKVLSAIIQETRQSGHPVAPPVCLLAGGETTVSLRGKGKGGRNMELALAAVEPLAGLASVVLLSAGTDGTDGPTDAAGAIVAGDTLHRAAAQGMRPQDYLRQNDSYTFFAELDDLLKTGPTLTNVMDLQLALIWNEK